MFRTKMVVYNRFSEDIDQMGVENPRPAATHPVPPPADSPVLPPVPPLLRPTVPPSVPPSVAPPIPPPVAPPVVIHSEVYKFTDSSHPGRILAGLHKQWTEDTFLDVTIRVNDVRLRAHRSVLSAFSRYFETLFDSNMCDAGLDEVNLPDIHVSGTAIRLLMEFAYCGTVEITPENIQDLLYAANFLLIDTVISACCTYLQNNLSVDNCVEVHELAVSLNQLELQQKTELFMISHFEEIVKEEVFLNIPVKLLIGLLEKDDFHVLENGFCVSKGEKEAGILKMILQFVEAKPEVNLEHLPTLLSRGVRLMLLPLSVLVSLKSSNLITSSPECLKLLNRIIASEVSSEEQNLWEHPRLCLVQYEKSLELASTTELHSEAPTEPFDDGNLAPDGQIIFVTGMKIYIRRWFGHTVIGGIEVFYNIGKSVLHGTAGYGLDNEDDEFHLGLGERIISINARAGWMVDQLQFTTNRDNVVGPFGGNGGGSHILMMSDRSNTSAYLAYITGTVDVTCNRTAVRRLCFVWGFYKH